MHRFGWEMSRTVEIINCAIRFAQLGHNCSAGCWIKFSLLNKLHRGMRNYREKSAGFSCLPFYKIVILTVITG